MTTKKKGRGRPKKTESAAPKSGIQKYLERKQEYFDVKTGEFVGAQNLDLARELSNSEVEKTNVPKTETVLEADFSILIDNETADNDVRFIQSGDEGLAEVMLAQHYLENFDFRIFINSIITRAARIKADRLTSELDSLGG